MYVACAATNILVHAALYIHSHPFIFTHIEKVNGCEANGNAAAIVIIRGW